MANRHTQLPQTLQEALIGQPLSHLVPVQDLAQFTTATSVNILTEPETGTADYTRYMKSKDLLDPDDPALQAHRDRTQGQLDLEREMGSFSVMFAATEELPEEESKTSFYSLFDGLNGLARGIANSVPLVSDEELLKVISQEEKNRKAAQNRSRAATRAAIYDGPSDRRTLQQILQPLPQPSHQGRPTTQVMNQHVQSSQCATSQPVVSSQCPPVHSSLPLQTRFPNQGAVTQAVPSPQSLQMSRHDTAIHSGQYFQSPISMTQAPSHHNTTQPLDKGSMTQIPTQGTTIQRWVLHDGNSQLNSSPHNTHSSQLPQLQAFIPTPTHRPSVHDLSHYDPVPTHVVRLQSLPSRGGSGVVPTPVSTSQHIHSIPIQSNFSEQISSNRDAHSATESDVSFSASTSASSARVTTTAGVMSVGSVSHRDSLPSPQEVPQLKKRKVDVSLQHLEMEKLSLQQLVHLVENKIFLTDEDAEYESSDLWIELPNTDHVLDDAVIMEVQNYLSKVIPTSLKTMVPLAILERLQQLCMKSVKHANDVDWTCCNEEIELKLAANTLKAISVILDIVNMQRTEKQLYLDDYIIESMTFLYNFTDVYILKMISQDKINENIMYFIGLIDKVLQQFSIHIKTNYDNETLITKLEYLCVMIIFQDGDKLLLSVKSAALSVLIIIFTHRRDQRSFIVDELLLNFDSLPTHKVTSRHLKMSNGVNIQFSTIVLLSLINVFSISEGYGNDSAIDLASLSKEEYNARIPEDVKFRVYAKQIERDQHEFCSTIASTLVGKLIRSTSFKAVLELLITDLLNLVTNPDFPSAEPLLCRFTECLVANTDGQPALVETILLEMLGLIGTTMLQIRGPDEPPYRSVNDLKESYSSVMSYLVSRSARYSNNNLAINPLMTKWIISLVDSIGSFETGYQNCEPEYSTLMSLLGWYHYKKRSALINETTERQISLKDVNVQYKTILQHSEFMSLYQNFLNHLLQSVDHPKIKSRTRALKNLAMLIEKDPRLIHIPVVKQTLGSRIKDSSPLVRLAVLDIFDQYILQKPELVGDFYQWIVLTSDKSTAVRNRSIKIARRIINGTDDQKIQVFLLEKVLKKLEDDEESVVESAKATLIEVFFLLPDYKANGSDVKLKEECTKLMLTIGKLIAKCQANWELFETFLFDDIIRMTDENKRSRPKFLDFCQKMTEALFIFVIENIDTERQKDVDICLGLLSVFSKSDTPFINQDQLMALQPYLTTDSTSSSSASYYALVVLKNTLSHTTSLRDQFLKNTQTSLMKKLTKLNTRELDMALPAVWTISVMLNDISKISNAACSCLSLILPYADLIKDNKLVENDSKVVRLLYLIGGFGKYCDLEKSREVFMKQQRLGLKEKETILSLLTKYILIFTKSSVNNNIRKAALRNVIHVATTHPKLFLNETILSVLDADLLEKEDLSVQSTMLQGILEFLEKEEKDAIQRAAKDDANGVDTITLIHGNQRLCANDDICASITQRYLETAVRLCTFGVSDTEIFTGVKFLRYVVRMGFANPVACIGPVIDMQISQYPYVRSVGLDLHRQLHEKYESLIDTHYASNVSRAFHVKFMKAGEHSLQDSMFVQRLYKVFEDSKSTRKKFLKQLPKTIDFKKIKSLDQMKEMEYYAAFLAANILECEFKTNEEVFFLIEGFEFILSVRGTELKYEIQKKIADANTDAVNLLGHCCSLVTITHKLVAALRHNYRLPESTSTSELKSQKSKPIPDKTTMKISFYSTADGKESAAFEEFGSLLI